MGAFEEFVESDLFFPILIGLLLLLIIIFVVILVFDRKKEKKYIEDLRKEIGSKQDLEATIQIPIRKVVKQVTVTKPVEEVVSIKQEEVKVIELPMEKEESTGLDLTKAVAPTIIKENPVKPKVEERNEIADDAPVVDLKIADTSSDESLEATTVVQVVEDENKDDELIVPEEVKQLEETGEEIEVKDSSVDYEEFETSVIELPKIEEDIIKEVEVEKPNAFQTVPDGNTDINEDIKYEPPKEYTSVKTEILDISDIVNKEE